jgi:ribosomal protein L40E
MPCYRCGTRQVDPVRGHSPWRRAVRDDQQVLVCPNCQATADWAADMDKCRQCNSVHLVRRLGEVECRDCGAVVPPAAEPAALTERVLPAALLAAGPGESAPSGRAPGLSEEVALALERVLGRGAPRGREAIAERASRNLGGPPSRYAEPGSPVAEGTGA